MPSHRPSRRIPALIGGGVLAGLAAAAPPPCRGEPPLWPLAERTCVTGSFGEYREGHFHAGVDLSTGGRIGLPVRAVARGRVVRLRASPYGYGRALYIDIDGGRQVVYGHLSAFASRWQALVEAEQERLGKYTVDFAVPDSSRVEAGDVVAYTGESGGGPPHLHFEVRHSDTDPINPLTHGWTAPDVVAPTIRAVRLVPLGLEGRVDGGLDPVVVPVTRAGKDGAYRAARAHTISGPVGVQVRAEDRATGCEDPRAIYGATLACDGAALFDERFEQVSYLTDWSEVDLRYDAAALDAGLGKYIRLYEPIGWAGALPVRLDGAHLALVQVTDAAGNVARAEISLRVEPAAQPFDTSPSRFADTGEDPPAPAIDPNQSPRITRRLCPEGLILRLGWDPTVPEKERVSARVSLSNRMVSAEAVPVAARTSAASWYVVPADRLDERSSVSLLREVAGGRGHQRLIQIQPLVKARQGADNEVRAARDVRANDDLPAGGARLIIRQGALYQDELLTGNVKPDAFRVPAGLVSHARPAQFDPPDLHLKQRAEVRFAIPDSLRPRAQRLAVYSVSPDGGIDCIGGSFDAKTGEIVATTRTLGTFALLEDASAPRLSRLTPTHGAIISNARPRLSVRVAEDGEGLDDEGVSFTIDGERLIPEYDPEADRITARPKRALAAGPHRIEIRLADKAGNEATLASRFTVTAPRRKGK